MMSEIRIDQPLFVLSLDTELAWGAFDKGGVEHYERQYASVRDVVDRLLEMFERHAIHATWAVVGHLFLESCSQDGPDHHNHVLQPEYGWYRQGWLSHDPFSNVREHPAWYAPDVVEKILGCGVRQEIASHTFTHAILGDPDCSAEVARSQLEGSIKVAASRGIKTRSLIFPRNRVGHLDVAADLGIRAYRGNGRYWYGKRGPAARLGHFCDQLFAMEPPVYSRVECTGECKIYNVPASMFFPPTTGKWRFLPLAARVKKARRGIEAAIRDKAIFHLWFHPFNLACAPELIDALDEILTLVAVEQRRNAIRSATMADVAALLDLHKEGAPCD